MNKVIIERSSSLQKRTLKITDNIIEALNICACASADPSCPPSTCVDLKKQLEQVLDIIRIQSKPVSE